MIIPIAMIINVSASHSNNEDTYTQLVSSETASITNSTDSQQAIVSEVCESVEPVQVQSKEQVSSNVISSTEGEITKVEPVVGDSYSIPNIDTSFKSFTPIHLVSKRSPQGMLIAKGYTDENGLHKLGDYYMVAMGNYYTQTVGDMFEITTSTGNIFKVIICDFKANKDTDVKHQYTVGDNSLLEFYVNINLLNYKIRQAGSASGLAEFDGSITKVIKLN